MYFLGVLCLLSAAVALPKSEQLHTNLPALPPPPELKSAEKVKSSVDDIHVIPIPIAPPPELPPLEEPEIAGISEKGNSDESKKPTESAEKPKEVNNEVKDKSSIQNVIEKESKESKDSIDSKESKGPLESKTSQELNEPKKSKESKEPVREPIESKEEKKDSKSDESVGDIGDDDDEPIFVEFDTVKPSSLPGWLSNLLSNIKWPFHLPSFLRPNRFRNPDQKQEDPCIYNVRE